MGTSLADIPDLRAFLLAVARRRWPGLDTIHEDLVGDTLRDLTASFRVDSARSESPEDQARAQATTILRRRVVDHFRRPVAEFAEETIGEAISDPSGLSEAQILYRRALRRTLAFLAEQSHEDRALLLDEIEGALSSALRKRRQRLRADLREWLESDLGADASELFSETE